MTAAPLDRTFTYRLHALLKLVDQQSRQAYEDELGIPHGESRCLAAIGAFGPLSVKVLAQAANLDKAQASRASQALAARQLVKREPDETDGRGVVLAASAEGQHVWRNLMAIINERNAQTVSCLSKEECKQFSELLDRVLEHARQTRGMQDR